MKKRAVFLRNINKTDKPLAKLTKRKKEGIPIKIIYGNRNATTDIKETHKIIRTQFKNLYFPKLENLKDIDGFLDIYNLSKLNQDKIRNVNRFSTSSEKQVVMKISQPKTGGKNQDQMQSILPELQRTPILLKLFHKIGTEKKHSQILSTKLLLPCY